jgi:hypothetical protein
MLNLDLPRSILAIKSSFKGRYSLLYQRLYRTRYWTCMQIVKEAFIIVVMPVAEESNITMSDLISLIRRRFCERQTEQLL